jgi:hypothetical protein
VFAVDPPFREQAAAPGRVFTYPLVQAQCRREHSASDSAGSGIGARVLVCRWLCWSGAAHPSIISTTRSMTRSVT